MGSGDCFWPFAAVLNSTVLTSALERKAAIKVVRFKLMLGSASGQKETVAKIYSVPLPRPIIFLLGFMPAHAKCFRGQLTELRTILCGKRTKPRKTITPGQCGNRPAAAAFRLEAAT